MGKDSLRDRATQIKKNTQPQVAHAQTVMRAEMEAGAHKNLTDLDGAIARADAAIAAVKKPDRDLDSSVVNGGMPTKLSDVLDEVVGMPMDEDVQAEAMLIISEHGEGLVLNWQQWPIVTKLVEHGIISGRAGS
ncbi:hypothetical protein SEA_MORRIGAN_64 [Microbacterium phage Morrigan]|nr:hypothetical protein SEA_MORRIGAN_64 [Microbacterium phage Morrigan]